MTNGEAGSGQAIRVLRVLCREEFGIASAKSFVEDVQRAMEWLSGHYIYTPEQVGRAPEVAHNLKPTSSSCIHACCPPTVSIMWLSHPCMPCMPLAVCHVSCVLPCTACLRDLAT